MNAKSNRLALRAPHYYGGADVPLRVIRHFARQVAKEFKPGRIILFGSHAYGRPHPDSDVDVLVVMPARNQLDMAARISISIDPPFPLDIIVRTPKNMRWRLAEGDSFLQDIVTRGKVLYEARNARVGEESRGRLQGSGSPRATRRRSA